MPYRDKEKARAYGLAWRNANREKYRSYFQKPEYKEYMKKYREDNREQILDYYRKYAENRREKDRARKIVLEELKETWIPIKCPARIGNNVDQ